MTRRVFPTCGAAPAAFATWGRNARKLPKPTAPRPPASAARRDKADRGETRAFKLSNMGVLQSVEQPANTWLEYTSGGDLGTIWWNWAPEHDRPSCEFVKGRPAGKFAILGFARLRRAPFFPQSRRARGLSTTAPSWSLTAGHFMAWRQVFRRTRAWMLDRFMVRGHICRRRRRHDLLVWQSVPAPSKDTAASRSFCGSWPRGAYRSRPRFSSSRPAG